MCQRSFDFVRIPAHKQVNQIKIVKDADTRIAVDQPQDTKVGRQLVFDVVYNNIVNVGSSRVRLKQRPVQEFDPRWRVRMLSQWMLIGGDQSDQMMPPGQSFGDQKTKLADRRISPIRSEPCNLHDSSFSIVFGQVTSSESRRVRAARPICSERALSEYSESIAPAMGFASGSATQPVSPLSTSCRTSAESVRAMIGLDADAA